MSDVIETTAASEPKAKRTPPKPKAKASNGKAGAGKAAKNDSGLSTAQVRILKALNKAKGALSRPSINAAVAKMGFATAKKFSAWMTEPLGQNDPKARKVAEKKSGKASLLTLGFVRMEVIHDSEEDELPRETVFEITASGRKALEKAN